MNQPIEEKWNWHEEFDKMRHAKGPFIVPSEAVKAFIENLLEQEKKRMSDEVEKAKIGGTQDWKGAFNDGLDVAKRIINK